MENKTKPKGLNRYYKVTTIRNGRIDERVGYDSRKNHLPEPLLEKVKSLYWELGKRGFTAVLTTMRKAWCKELEPSEWPQAICCRTGIVDTGNRPAAPANNVC